MSASEVSAPESGQPTKKSSTGVKVLTVVLVVAAVAVGGYVLVSRVIGKNWTVARYEPASAGVGPVPGSYLIDQPTSPISQNVKACAGGRTFSTVRLTAPQEFTQIIVCPLGIGMAGVPRNPNDPPLTPAKFKALSAALAAPDQRAVFGKSCAAYMTLTNQVLVLVNGQWMWPAVPTDACGQPSAAAQAALGALPHS